jgi:hypothetical protein
MCGKFLKDVLRKYKPFLTAVNGLERPEEAVPEILFDIASLYDCNEDQLSPIARL